MVTMMGEILEVQITVNGKSVTVKIDKTMMDEYLSNCNPDSLEYIRSHYIAQELPPFILDLTKDLV